MNSSAFPVARIASLFVAALGFVVTTASMLGGVGWVPLGECIAVSIAVCSLYYFAWYLPGYRTHLAFFGLSGGVLNILVPSYQNRVPWDAKAPDEQRLRYKKKQGEGERYLEGSHDYVTGLQSTKDAFQFGINLGQATSWDVNLVGDEENNRWTPGPLLSLGSPTSNDATDQILKGIPGDHSPTFTTNSLKCWLHPDPYKSDANNDYGVLVRAAHGNRVAFVCAGIDEEGTIAAMRYLLENWRELRKESRKRKKEKFISIFGCRKSDLSLNLLATHYW